MRVSIIGFQSTFARLASILVTSWEKDISDQGQSGIILEQSELGTILEQSQLGIFSDTIQEFSFRSACLMRNIIISLQHLRSFFLLKKKL